MKKIRNIYYKIEQEGFEVLEHGYDINGVFLKVRSNNYPFEFKIPVLEDIDSSVIILNILYENRLNQFRLGLRGIGNPGVKRLLNKVFYDDKEAINKINKHYK